MNRFLKNTIATVALLLWFAEAGAGGTVNIVQQLEGKPTTCALGIKPDVNDDGLCTLSIGDISTPYSVKEVSAIRLMAGNNAQSRRNAPEIDHTPISINKVEENVYTFNMPAEPYDVEVTVNFTYREFPLKVNGIGVTGENMLHILALKDSTVAYNGNGVLILNQKSEDETPVAPVTVESALGRDLTIYIKGYKNILESVKTSGENEKLIITTIPNNPGMLTLKAAEGKEKVIEGFTDVELQENLAWREGDKDAAMARIGVYIKPLVEETKIQPKTDDLDPNTLGDENKVTTDNPEEDKTVVLNKVLDEVILITVTIADEDGAQIPFVEEDSEEAGKSVIILNTSVQEEDIEKALKEEPGSNDFAKVFDGITLKLAAGSGDIVLDVEVEEGSVLMVKIGNEKPIQISESGEVKIPYVCQEPTFVLIYNGTPDASGARSIIHRLKVRTAPVRMRSVSVQPSVVQEDVDPEADAAPDVMLDETKDEEFSSRGVYTPTDNDITTLADNLFEGKTDNLNTIDLSNTAVKDIEVSREEGPFKGVLAQTFIYLPAGNTVKEGEPNVVIGGICANMQLSEGDMPFEPAKDFGAQKATLGREFISEQTSTVYLPFDIDKTSAEALGHFYTFKGISTDGDADLNDVTEGLTANTPYIFKKSAEGKITVNNVTVKKEKPDAIDAKLVGTYQLITWTSELLDEKKAQSKYIYGFAATDQGEDIKAGEFVRVGAGATVKPYRAYLELTENYGTRIQINWGDDATGINEVGNLREAGAWYTLDGRRLSTVPAKRGLYIHNGKKTIVNK